MLCVSVIVQEERSVSAKREKEIEEMQERKKRQDG